MRSRLYIHNNPAWKGNNVSLRGLHRWLRENFLQPERCQECGLVKKILDLANVTGVYDRNIKNYRYLCRRCHFRLDKAVDTSSRICYFCGANNSYKRKNRQSELWLHIDCELACVNCWNKDYRSKKIKSR